MASVARVLAGSTLMSIAVLACFSSAARKSDVGQSSEAEVLRATERHRLRTLVDADTAAAMLLHAPDFHLVTPDGSTMTREVYLRRLASKNLDYVAWDPVDSISVRVHGSGAVLRYKSRLLMVVAGRSDTLKPFGHWHTDFYEKRDGRWQVVWSQATQIR